MIIMPLCKHSSRLIGFHLVRSFNPFKRFFRSRRYSATYLRKTSLSETCALALVHLNCALKKLEPFLYLELLNVHSYLLCIIPCFFVSGNHIQLKNKRHKSIVVTTKSMRLRAIFFILIFCINFSKVQSSLRSEKL